MGRAPIGGDAVPPYDLVLANGTVLDPSQRLHAVADVAIADGRVAAVGPALPREEAARVIDVSGKLVTPGLIDLHAHVYWGGTSLGIDPDALSARAGVTTFVDAGSAGAGNIRGFRRHLIERARVRASSWWENRSTCACCMWARPSARPASTATSCWGSRCASA